MNSSNASGASNGWTTTSRRTKSGNRGSMFLGYPKKPAKLSCLKRNENEDLETFSNVKPIISHRETVDGDVEYFCKWQGLNYDRCTWELQKDVNPIAKEHIATYQKREAEAKFPYKSVSYHRNSRPEFKRMHKDPEYIAVTGGSLKD